MNPYFLYMMEKEGMDNYVTTREAKINAVVRDLKYILTHNPNADVNDYFPSVCRKHKLENVTAEEARRMSARLK